MVLAYQEQDDKGKSKRKLEVFEKYLKEEGLEIETEHATVINNEAEIKIRQLFKIILDLPGP